MGKHDHERPQDEMPAGGVYIALFGLSTARSIRVGGLGSIGFRAGVYAYVGSAQRSLAARLARHARRRKPLRWHIDYLSTRSSMLGAVVIQGPKTMECRLANALARTGASPVAGFGCSDCRCQSHLYRVSWGSVCHQDPNG